MSSSWKTVQVQRMKQDFFSHANYTSSAVLGKGSFGQVVLAKKPNCKDRAVKMLARWSSTGHPMDLTHFFQEAKAVSNLKHRCLVQAYAAAMCPNFAYIVMAV